MDFVFPNKDSLSLSVLDSGGTAGTGDRVLAIQFSCRGHSFTGTAYCEFADIQDFVADLTLLPTGTKTSASLAADDPRDFQFHVSALDRLGHSALVIEASQPIAMRSHTFRAASSGVFALESQQVAELGVYFQQCIRDVL